MAATRDVDLAFDSGEKLWRRIEIGDVFKADVKKGIVPSVKPNRLRLQISTVRAKHGELSSVVSEKWNGVAETTAEEAAAIVSGNIQLACIDDPTDAVAGHALIAMYSKPGAVVDEGAITLARASLAEKMRIKKMPTKV